jgi:hypothetical protein
MAARTEGLQDGRPFLYSCSYFPSLPPHGGKENLKVVASQLHSCAPYFLRDSGYEEASREGKGFRLPWEVWLGDMDSRAGSRTK